LVRVSTQPPEQASVGAGQASMHLPAAHAWVAAQRTPHPPQFAGSIWTWTQAFPQRAKFVEQAKPHLPAAHWATP
jgi:hypothetical protein